MDAENRPPTIHGEEAKDGACPSFIAAMDVVGRRWSGIIIEAIGRGNTGFADISRFITHIGDAMLAKRLRELEIDGLVQREVLSGPPIRVKYSLTVAGLALLPILQDLTSWGHDYSIAQQSSIAELADPARTEGNQS